MVTWGPNTTHTFGSAPAAPGGPTPPPPAFGSSSTSAPAPVAGGSLFGSTPAPTAAAGGSLFGSTPAAPAAPTGGLFGSTPAPAPLGGGLFGSTPAPAPNVGFSSFGTTPSSGSSLFGNPAPAPGGSLFGSAPSGGSLFGAPAPALFGGGSSLFGAATPATAAGASMQQLPAQAALQAHMDASARQEAERVRIKLDALNYAYAGIPQGGNEGGGAKFVAIVYSPLTPEERQLRWMQGIVSTGIIPMPPRPPQVSEKQWLKAVAENPDPENYVPQPLVGAHELQTRLGWQQTRANDLANHASSLHQAHETLQERLRLAIQDVEIKVRKHNNLRKQLLDVMRRVELTRCLHQPIQPDELRVIQRLSDIHKQIDYLQQILLQLQEQVRLTIAKRTSAYGGDDEEEVAAGESSHLLSASVEEQLVPVLKDHREKIQRLVTITQKDQRDVGLIARRGAVVFPPTTAGGRF